MTQVAKPSYEPVEATPRKAFTVAEHRIIRERQGDVCAICGQRERAYQFDHVLPIELGGAHSVANAQMLCLICHRHKTAVDVRRIRKAARLRKKSDPETRKPSRMRSRGFDKTRRRKMDGTVESALPKDQAR